MSQKTADRDKVRAYIRQCINIEFGTMTAYAAKEKVSLQYISNVMSGNKPIPDWMYKRFKINHVVSEYWTVEGDPWPEVGPGETLDGAFKRAQLRRVVPKLQ